MKCTFSWLFFLVSFNFLACQNDTLQKKKSLSSLLSSLESHDQSSKLDLILVYPDRESARLDLHEINSRHIEIQSLDSDQRIFRILADKQQIRELEVDSRVQLNRNSRVKITKANESKGSTQLDANHLAQELLTVRSVVGVDKLQMRFPQATGKGLKIAVFDTGIDFGVEGLSDPSHGENKLVGFFDLTQFGRVKTQAVLPETELKLKFQGNVQPQAILSQGVLSEIELAKFYMVSEGVDINANGQHNDEIAFAVGVNQDHRLAVWIDTQGDHIISDREKQELTDYNSSQKFMSFTQRSPMNSVNHLAVTITSTEEVQFHRVLEGHGTSCALIIGGDGYANGHLKGLAPKVSFVSYTLDTWGQDIYTMDEFLRMFLHAKSQGVDAISISWGFSTADLNSARFVADFLDKEIAGAGILLAIAAGNEGPGVGSAAPDDYIPHHGFAVGAMLSQAQAQNVYGWTGVEEDAVVDYSSFGPTVGGRMIPDVISPIISLVRGNVNNDESPFYGFSGTSSATPALVGASATLISALKNTGHDKIDMRLLKLAIQNSATPLKNTMLLRQGPGVIAVDKAYDLYVTLKAEDDNAKKDLSHRSAFAYELRAQTQLPGKIEKGEGIYLFNYEANKKVDIKLSQDSLNSIDPMFFVEPLVVHHTQDFMDLPEMISLQSNGSSIQIKFRKDKLTTSGVYSDVISISRPKDGLVLLRIPVVLQLSKPDSNSSTLATINEVLPSFAVWRQAVELTRAQPLVFRGQVMALDGYEGARISMVVRARNGHVAAEQRFALNGPSTNIEFRTDKLPVGYYELLIARVYKNPAVVSPVTVVGGFYLPKFNVLNASFDASTQQVHVALKAQENISWSKMELKIEGARVDTRLTRRSQEVRPGFFGDVTLPFASSKVGIHLRQDRLDQIQNEMLHMSLTLFSSADQMPLFRGWINVEDQGSPISNTQDLGREEGALQVLAYPNIVNWDTLKTKQLTLEMKAYRKEPIQVNYTAEKTQATQKDQLSFVDFYLDALSTKAFGQLLIYAEDGSLVEKLPIEIQTL